MPLEIDYIPFATGGGANVMAQTTYATDAPSGVVPGLADPTFANKAWRQSSMIAAAVANFIANTLQINVDDDGNLTNLIANFTSAIEQVAGAEIEPNAGIVTYSSTTALLFSPKNGGYLRVNGALIAIPTAGVSIANTGVEVGGVAAQNLAASTTYDLYLKNVASVLTPSFYLDAGGGTHMSDTTAGNVGTEVRSNGGVPDSTRTLIGKVRTNGAGQFQQQSAGGFINWFNRRDVMMKASVANVNFSGNTMAEVTTSLRVNFLTWGDEAPSASVDGSWYNSLTGGSGQLMASFDTNEDGSLLSDTDWSATNGTPYSVANSGEGLAEGFHYHTLYGSAGGSTTATLQTGYNRVQVRG